MPPLPSAGAGARRGRALARPPLCTCCLTALAGRRVRRRYSELLSRPQYDRVVVRDGRPLDLSPPPYELLDFVPAAIASGKVALAEVSLNADGTALVDTRVGPPLKIAGLPRIAAAVGSLGDSAGGSIAGVRSMSRTLSASLAADVAASRARLQWLVLACLGALLATALSAAGLGRQLLAAVAVANGGGALGA